MIAYHVEVVQFNGMLYNSEIEVNLKAEEIEEFFSAYPNFTFKVTTLMDSETWERDYTLKQYKQLAESAKSIRLSVPW